MRSSAMSCASREAEKDFRVPDAIATPVLQTCAGGEEQAFFAAGSFATKKGNIHTDVPSAGLQGFEP